MELHYNKKCKTDRIESIIAVSKVVLRTQETQKVRVSYSVETASQFSKDEQGGELQRYLLIWRICRGEKSLAAVSAESSLPVQDKPTMVSSPIFRSINGLKDVNIVTRTDITLFLVSVLLQ